MSEEKKEGLEVVSEPLPYGIPTAAQLNKINKLAKRKLSADEVFVTSAKFIGDGLLTDRALKIDESLLEVYHKNAKEGVAFMLDHPWSGLQPAYSYGRTFDSRLEDSQNPSIPDETKAIYGDIYIVRGKEKNGVSTDEIIKDIEDGTLFDVSIGFGYETAVCSICGEDIRDYDKCPHLPGKMYEVDGKQELCYTIAKPPGYLMEISGVFDGAYPTAGFSQGGGETSWIPVDNIKETPRGTQLLHTYSQKFGVRTFRKNGPTEVKEPMVVTPVIDEERAKEIAGANWQENLFVLATEGKELRDDLIEEVLKMGVRAMGEAFDMEFHREVLHDSALFRIKRFREQFLQKAREEIPTGRKIQPTFGDKEIPLGAFRKE